MIGRLFIASILTLLLGFLTFQLWDFLRETDSAKIVLIAEAESYATRSRLVQQIDQHLRSLRHIHDFWVANAARAVDDWPEFQGPGFSELAGLTTLFWRDHEASREFLVTPEYPVMNRVASSAEVQTVELLRRGTEDVSGEVLLGPDLIGDTRHLRVVIRQSDGGGTLVAVVDPAAMFADFLRDQSPGYAVAITWRGQTLFRQDTPAEYIPEAWVREGMIRTSIDSVFTVTHAPTAALAASLVTPAVSAVVPLGLAVSLLVGLLVFENGRVNLRAAAAADAERRLAALNRTLEAEVADRTVELERRNADLVTISESVSHDLRTPLNALSMNLELLAQEQAERRDGRAAAARQRCQASVQRMASILDRVVGLSMATHSTFQRERLDMRELIEEVFEQLRAGHPDVATSLEIESLPEVAADDILVRILVLNLLDNAIEHGGPRIRVDGDTTVPDGPAVYRIENTGCDIDPDQAASLFEAFQTDTDEPGAHRGLGLAIAERVVRRHGGRIWVNAEPPGTFAVCFTLQPAAPG